MEEKVLIKSRTLNIIIVSIIFVFLLTIVATFNLSSNAVKNYNHYADGYNTAKITGVLEDNIYCDHAYYVDYYDDYFKEQRTVYNDWDTFESYHPTVMSYIKCLCQERKQNVIVRLIGKDNLNASLIIYGIALLIIFLNFWLSKHSITVTDSKIYGTGNFRKKFSVPLDKISTVGTSLFNGLDIGTSSGKIKCKLIENRDEIQSEISKILIERQKNDEVKNSGSKTQASGADELKKYKDLLDSGIITAAEFDEKKRQILNL